jgi:DNA-binding NtrC family response regulator
MDRRQEEEKRARSFDRQGALSTSVLDRARLSAGDQSAGLRVSLLLYHRDGVEAAPLVEGQSLVIGRAYPADLAIADESLSRQHARVEITDGEIWVEDLGSTNGTWVDGELVERCPVGPESELVLGTVVVAVHALGSWDDVAGLDGHDRFQRILEAEVNRARAFGRELALILVQDSGEPHGHVRRWLPEVRRLLRPFDVPALYSADTFEAILPEAGIATARATARLLSDHVDGLRCGIGVFPNHGGSAEELLEVTGEALRATSATERVVVGRTTPSAVECTASTEESPGPVARSSAMLRVLEAARRFSNTSMPVLIQGETGTGKEVVARLIHDWSERRDKPMICVNCGAIPAQLVESTLFGHEKGAFTGASTQARGVFETAEGGTVLLDEIGEMPIQAQAALLRVIETRRFNRVGSAKELKVNVRIIAATHRDLEKMCETGEFRRDLFYRLDAMAVRIPPLHKRPEDIEPLIARFIHNANRANARSIAGTDDEALERLLNHAWPGNVRELRNTIERAVVIARGDRITTADLPERICWLPSRRAPAQSSSNDVVDEPLGVESIDLRSVVSAYETKLVLNTLKAVSWDRNRAAKALSLPVRTLSFKMQQLDIKKPG